MRKARFFVIVAALSVGTLFLFGCNTAKGAATGVATGVGATVVGTAKGAVKDVKDTRNFIVKADEWVKKNLW